MSRLQTVIGLGIASAMMLTAPAFAAAPATAKTATTAKTTTTAAKPATTAAKPAAAKPVAAKPVAKTAAKKTAAGGNYAKATLKNGKTVTYNCNLAGNKSKQACKK